MEQNKKNISEIINNDNTTISGGIPQCNTGEISSTQTGDEIQRKTGNARNSFYATYGLGYSLLEGEKQEEEVLENVLPKKEYNAFDVIDNTTVELPNIYSISNPNLVSKLKSLISTLNSDNNEQDIVAVFSDFIKNVNIKDISHAYKKELLKLLKDKI